MIFSCLVLLRLCILVVCFGENLLPWCSLCCTVLVECVAFEAVLCGDVWDIFVMYGSIIFSSVFVITERSEMGLYDAPMFMSLLGFGIGMIL